MLTADEIQQHRVDNLEPEFLDRFRSAGRAAVYEFETQVEADEARAVLLSTAFLAAERGQVVRVPWKDRHRVMAIPQ